MDGTLIGIITLRKSKPGCNRGNRGVLHSPQSSRAGASPLDEVYHTQDTPLGGRFTILPGMLLVYYKPR